MINDDKFIKILSLTTSDSDGECLNAMRRVNTILKEEKITWDDCIKSYVSSRERLVKFLNLTTSDSDGECLNAIRKANKVVKDNNLTWNQCLSFRNKSSGATSGSDRPFGFGRPRGRPFTPPEHGRARSFDFEDIINQMNKAAKGFSDLGGAFGNMGGVFSNGKQEDVADIDDIADAMDSLFGKGKTEFTSNEFFRARKHAQASKRQDRPYTKKDRMYDDNEPEPDNYAEFDNGTDEVTFFNMDDDELEIFLKRKCTSKNIGEKQLAHSLLEGYNNVGSFYHHDRVSMVNAWEIKK